MAKKDNGNAADALVSVANELNVNVSTVLANVAADLGVTDLPPAVADYAPPDDPDRMERTAELCGAAIRAAGKSLAQSILDVAADGLARATSNKVDAEHLAAEILRVADEQATQAEKTMLDMKGTGALFAAEKLRISESSKANV